jgi:hypothetical protein
MPPRRCGHVPTQLQLGRDFLRCRPDVTGRAGLASPKWVFCLSGQTDERSLRRTTLTVQGQDFYSTLAADVATVLCAGPAWALLAALPEPWETPATAQRNVYDSPEDLRAVPIEFLSP